MLITGESTWRMPRALVSRAIARDTWPTSVVSHVAASADRLRKGGRAFAHQPVQRLLERNDGNAEPRLLDEVFLDGVDPFGMRARGVRAVGLAEIWRPKTPFE